MLFNADRPFTNTTATRYYHIYIDILLPICPGLVDQDLFGSQLQSFLGDRDRIVAKVDSTPHIAEDHSASWFALLFSVLACGAQCLSTIDKEAELNSKIFGIFPCHFLVINFKLTVFNQGAYHSHVFAKPSSLPIQH